MTTALSPRRRSLTLVGVLALFALEPTLGFLTSNIANIITAFDVEPGQATWVITAGSLAMIPIAVLGGAVAGRWLSYRTLAFMAVGIYTVAGLMPLFTGESFALLIATRVLWGFGAGLNFTLANSLIAVSYQDEQQRARVFGIGNVVFSISAVISTIIGGGLAAVSWQAPFLGYLIGIIAFILIAIFLQEPPASQHSDAAEDAIGGSQRVPLLAWGPLLAFGVAVVSMYPIISLNSVLFVEADLGGVELVGLVGSIPTAIGFFVSLAFGLIYKYMGRWVLPIASLFAAAGMALAYFATPEGDGSLPLYCVAFGLVGAGLMGLTIGTPMVLTTIVPPRVASLTQGLFAGMLNLGAVVSSFYITFAIGAFGGETGRVSPVLLVSAGILALLSIALVFIARLRRSTPATAQESETVAVD